MKTSGPCRIQRYTIRVGMDKSKSQRNSQSEQQGLMRSEEVYKAEAPKAKDLAKFSSSRANLASSESNGYSLKDTNKAKADKTKHGNGKSVKNQSQCQQVNDEADIEEMLNGSTHTHLMGWGKIEGSDGIKETQDEIEG
ncbi:hypothetical protein Tco_0609061 [Tanacetum coccineum]